MDRYEGPAPLEWWANASTCPASLGVHIAVRVTGDDWACEALLDPPLSDEGLEGFGFLMRLDPLFTLRFADDTTYLVTVVVTGGEGRLALAPYEPDGTHPAGSRRVEWDMPR